jgi:hypothetical protein
VEPGKLRIAQDRINRDLAGEYGGTSVELRPAGHGKVTVRVFEGEMLTEGRAAPAGVFEIVLSKHAGEREVTQKVKAGILSYFRRRDREVLYEAPLYEPALGGLTE